MVHLMSILLLVIAAAAPAFAFAFVGGSLSGMRTAASTHRYVSRRYSHSNVVSPYYYGSTTSPSSTTSNTSTKSTSSHLLESLLAASTDFSPEGSDTDTTTEQRALQDLCELLNVQPNNLLRLESNVEDGVRGLYINQDIPKGDLILRIPLESCLRDDDPPEWWLRSKEDNEDDNEFSYGSDNWAARLAASVLDLQLKKLEQGEPLEVDNQSKTTTTQQGKELWLSFLPNANYLRATLPIHWSEDTLQSARCTELELAVDSAYFARADAIAQLLVGLQQYHPTAHNLSQEELNLICHNALDIVQTRSCRAEPVQNDNNDDGITIVSGSPPTTPLRVLAPVFDLINHGSSNSRGEGSANAKFGVEDSVDDDDDDDKGPFLCVRANRDLSANDEVLIDYGGSAKPAWKCLLSYGFVPRYPMRGVDDDNDDDEEEELADENVAEVYMWGKRYEVGPSTIPFDMVEAFIAATTAEKSEANADSPQDTTEETVLTPDIALKLAKRISDVSFYLLLDDQKRSHDASSTAKNDSTEPTTATTLDNPEENVEEIIALRAASSLRWSHHRILRVCSKGLQEWANR